jgi:hypothetical protein
LPISAIIAFGFIGVGLWLTRRARVYADAAEWAEAKGHEEVGEDLNDWSVGFYKLAVAAYGVTIGLTVGHALWPHL